MHISTTGCYLLEETLNLKFNSLPKSCFWCSGGDQHIQCTFTRADWGSLLLFWFWKLRERYVIHKTATLSLPVNKFVPVHQQHLGWSYMSHSHHNHFHIRRQWFRSHLCWGVTKIWWEEYSVLNFVHSKKLEGWGSFAILYTSTVADC